MRLLVVAAMLAGVGSLGACSFMNASGGAAQRWAARENARAAKANPTGNVEKICKSMTPTGSIMPQRVCSTRAEWEAFDEETSKSADLFNELRRSGSLEPATEGFQHQAE